MNSLIPMWALPGQAQAHELILNNLLPPGDGHLDRIGLENAISGINENPPNTPRAFSRTPLRASPGVVGPNRRDHQARSAVTAATYDTDSRSV
jgi:hypothetical protein